MLAHWTLLYVVLVLVESLTKVMTACEDVTYLQLFSGGVCGGKSDEDHDIM